MPPTAVDVGSATDTSASPPRAYRSRCSSRLAKFWQEKVTEPLRSLSLRELLIAIIIGLLGGIFPVPLITTAVTLLLGHYISCSFPQKVFGTTVNMFCTPLQLALLPPLARLTGTLMQRDISAFSSSALRVALKGGYISFASSCGLMILYATVSWFLIAIPITFAIRAAQQMVGQKMQ